MNITILGGGNIGMCLVGEISRIERYKVTLYASKPAMFSEIIQVEDDEKGIVYQSGMFVTTDNLKEAVCDADVILCTLPAFLRENIIKNIENDIKEGTYLGFFPGYGGAEFYCKNLLEKGVTIFALQKVPYVARTRERGKIAHIMSKKTEVFIASLPMEKCSYVARLLEDMLLMKCNKLNNYMAATLLPGNPLLHTSGSYVYLKDYRQGQILKEKIYYYQSWNNECSEIILGFSDELHMICEKLPVNLNEVQTIQEYYEAGTSAKLTEKFHEIPSFQPLVLPMKKEKAGYIPDFSSRFYVEDFPFGVCIIKALALIADVKTPIIDEILRWYKKMTGKQYFNSDDTFGKDIEETAIPQLFGINSGKELFDFYMR
ncbi:MAG: NAD/NADP octopine/nopaline dehydrogenase family protein [Ruminococcus flavefaciens]|nr:NAD/NADP octopine/nopaline dehydrogenase family protein [Ruminococcus flavefaciens]